MHFTVGTLPSAEVVLGSKIRDSGLGEEPVAESRWEITVAWPRALAGGSEKRDPKEIIKKWNKSKSEVAHKILF